MGSYCVDSYDLDPGRTKEKKIDDFQSAFNVQGAVEVKRSVI